MIMNICLFEADEIGKPLSLKDERGQHLVKILHKKEGDSFTAGIVGGAAGLAQITKITPEGIFFDFTPAAGGSGAGKPLYPLKMIIGFPRPIQLKRLLRDVAALGVSEVHLTGTELGEKSYLQSTLLEKGNAYKMLWDGTVQAGGTHIPDLFMHKSLTECLEALGIGADSAGGACAGGAGANGSGRLLLALDNVRPTTSLGQAVKEGLGKVAFDNQREVVAAIGSERGWTDRERDFFLQKGFSLCGMGCRIMRTETAATVAGSIILNEMGYLK